MGLLVWFPLVVIYWFIFIIKIDLVPGLLNFDDLLSKQMKQIFIHFSLGLLLCYKQGNISLWPLSFHELELFCSGYIKEMFHR